jgi:hypothetical protein
MNRRLVEILLNKRLCIGAIKRPEATQRHHELGKHEQSNHLPLRVLLLIQGGELKKEISGNTQNHNSLIINVSFLHMATTETKRNTIWRKC